MLRTCIGCRRVAPPEELIRMVTGPEGSLVVGRHMPGRGAWLCAGSPTCLDAAAHRRAFGRALRADIDASAVAGLRAALDPAASRP